MLVKSLSPSFTAVNIVNDAVHYPDLGKDNASLPLQLSGIDREYAGSMCNREGNMTLCTTNPDGDLRVFSIDSVELGNERANITDINNPVLIEKIALLLSKISRSDIASLNAPAISAFEFIKDRIEQLC